MASAVFSALLPSRRRERKDETTEEAQVSKFSARFGDVAITAPTTGGWSEYESSKDISSYSTIPNLERLLSSRSKEALSSNTSRAGSRTRNRDDSITSTGTRRVLGTNDSLSPHINTPDAVSASTSPGLPVNPKGLPKSPKPMCPYTTDNEAPTRSRHSLESAASSGRPSTHTSPTFSQNSHTVHHRSLADIAVSPRCFPPEGQAQQHIEQQMSQESPQSMQSSRGGCRARHGRSASMGPQTRRESSNAVSSVGSGNEKEKDTDADTVFDFDSEGEDVRSVRSRDSGFIFDDLDVEGTSWSSSGGVNPRIDEKGWGVSRGVCAVERDDDRVRSELVIAVQNAERRVVEAEKETENVRQLLAAVKEKKRQKKEKKKIGLGKGLWGLGKDRDREEKLEKNEKVFAKPDKEMVGEAEDIWG